MNPRMRLAALLALATIALRHPAGAQTEPAIAPPAADAGASAVRIGILSDATDPYALADGASNVIAALPPARSRRRR